MKSVSILSSLLISCLMTSFAAEAHAEACEMRSSVMTTKYSILLRKTPTEGAMSAVAIYQDRQSKGGVKILQKQLGTFLYDDIRALRSSTDEARAAAVGAADAGLTLFGGAVIYAGVEAVTAATLSQLGMGAVSIGGAIGGMVAENFNPYSLHRRAVIKRCLKSSVEDFLNDSNLPMAQLRIQNESDFLRTVNLIKTASAQMKDPSAKGNNSLWSNGVTDIRKLGSANGVK